MGSAKKIVVRPIGSAEASDLVRRVHYSGKVTQNSQLHLGVYYAGRLEGVMQFGPPLDRRKVLPLVRGTLWNQMLELNRMAFTDALPRNSESRAMAVAFRMLRKHRPDIKWILSFSDATQCGDGTIYRASGFVLTGIKRNTTMLRLTDGSVVAAKTLDNHRLEGGRFGSSVAKEKGAKPLPGCQFRYIRFLDPKWRDRLAVPVIPFKDIPAEARMVRGKRTRQPEEDRCTPAGGRRGRSDPDAPSQ